MYNDNKDLRLLTVGTVIGVILLFVGLIGVAVTSSPNHHRHYKHQVLKLKGGRYAYKNHKGEWWMYTLKAVKKAASEIDIPDIALPDSDFAQPWATNSGSIRLPVGGTWTKCNEPPQEEIETELEASIEETAEGPEADSADSGADADSAGDGSDAGADGADGGDGGDGGGGDGGGGGE
jgi:uncharacterized membrane protein YgcG